MSGKFSMSKSDSAKGDQKPKEKGNVVNDKDRYPDAEHHIFWTELGIDPNKMKDMKLKPKYQYYHLEKAEVCCFEQQKVYVI